ncbi:MAG: DUF4350 domain-containing protein [Microcystaceae cyanobacterium]
MKRSSLILSLIALVVVLLLLLIFAPTQSSVTRGSTYGRQPADYGAWYQWMSARNIKVNRWRKPWQDLPTDQPLTLIRVYGSLIDQLEESEQKWVEKGNTLILLGVRQPATSAPFKSFPLSAVGKVVVQTTRRYNGSFLKISAVKSETLLGDRFGAIVARLRWENRGQLIVATTPSIGANAYQDSEVNYDFLREIVTQPGYPIYIDEYLHGHRDQDTLTEEVGATLWSYLQKTPLWLVFIQLMVIVTVMLWAKNRRFGRLQALVSPRVNNSRSYIDGLASVLEKADQNEFVIKMIIEDEKNKLSDRLGIQLEYDGSLSALIEAWSQKTGKSTQELRSLLQFPQSQSRVKRSDLAQWLEKWQQIR